MFLICPERRLKMLVIEGGRKAEILSAAETVSGTAHLYTVTLAQKEEGGCLWTAFAVKDPQEKGADALFFAYLQRRNDSVLEFCAVKKGPAFLPSEGTNNAFSCAKETRVFFSAAPHGSTTPFWARTEGTDYTSIVDPDPSVYKTPLSLLSCLTCQRPTESVSLPPGQQKNAVLGLFNLLF